MYQLIIIDDEEKIAEGIANLFPWERIGFSVAAYFQSAKKALAYMKRNKVDVVVSDIEMPGMSGLELCEQLMKDKIRVVFISSFQNYEYLRSATQYKVEDYLLKPVKFEELNETFLKIKEALDKEQCSSSEEPLSYYNQIIEKVKNYIREHYMYAS